jgi:hypothetical protein
MQLIAGLKRYLVSVSIAYPANNIGLTFLKFLQFFLGITSEIDHAAFGAGLLATAFVFPDIPEPVVAFLPELDVLPSLIVIA